MAIFLSGIFLLKGGVCDRKARPSPHTQATRGQVGSCDFLTFRVGLRTICAGSIFLRRSERSNFHHGKSHYRRTEHRSSGRYDHTSSRPPNGRGFGPSGNVLLFFPQRQWRQMPHLFGQSDQRLRKRPPPHAQTCGFVPNDGDGWHGGSQ